jgi:hypothetical protein
MTRHKSRVARRSRHRARRGTRKQSGGSWFASLFGSKPADATGSGKTSSWLGSFFGASPKTSTETDETKAAAVAQPAADAKAAADANAPDPATPPPLIGGRKTRHRRRRSPRRHRK